MMVGRCIGFVDGNTLTCKRDEAKHMFRSGKCCCRSKDRTASWGLDCKVCDGLISRSVEWLVIVSKTKIYRCKLTDMRDKGYVLNMKPHRPQYFLNLEHFEMGCD